MGWGREELAPSSAWNKFGKIWNYSGTEFSFFLFSIIGHKSIMLYYCHFWKLAIIFGEDLFFGEETAIPYATLVNIFCEDLFLRYGVIIFGQNFLIPPNCFGPLRLCLVVTWFDQIVVFQTNFDEIELQKIVMTSFQWRHHPYVTKIRHQRYDTIFFSIFAPYNQNFWLRQYSCACETIFTLKSFLKS